MRDPGNKVALLGNPGSERGGGGGGVKEGNSHMKRSSKNLKLNLKGD